MNPKQKSAEKAVTYIRNGMTVGLGTGSTAFFATQKIGQMVKNGLEIKAIATSLPTEKMASELNIPLTNFAEVEKIDITIDGADEIDGQFNLVKGGGGALLREKIVAAATVYYIIVADESKLVQQLGVFPLPVEIIPFGFQLAMRQLEKLGCEPQIRKKDGRIFITDNGNYIADCAFKKIVDPFLLNEKIRSITGVVETGLFLNMADLVIAGHSDGSLKVSKTIKK